MLMTEPLVRLKNVSKAFGSKVILDQVNLDIYPDQAVGVIGPSGTGKSTVMRLISGLLAPDSGEIYIKDHKRLRTIEQGENPYGVGLVFQQSALFDSLTVYENVGFELYRYSSLSNTEIEELVDEKLVLVGLPNTGHLYPSELSGGMQKRISLARAIVTDPNIDSVANLILYDEPTAGLDPVASTRIETLIYNLLKQEKACLAHLIVTHVHSTIRNTTDRIVFVYEGKIQWDGSTDEAFQSEHPLLKQFFSGSMEGPIT
ncbi:MAG: ABC transporter ATP-binding protein [Microcystaceae cyanobacterium]